VVLLLRCGKDCGISIEYVEVRRVSTQADKVLEQHAPPVAPSKAPKQKQQSKFDQAASAAKSRPVDTGIGESLSSILAQSERGCQRRRTSRASGAMRLETLPKHGERRKPLLKARIEADNPAQDSPIFPQYLPLAPCIGSSRTRSFSSADFFADTPWLNVPQERLANILIEPIYPRGGLLGGSAVAVKPQSKLAALAAARKKAAEDKKRGAEVVESSIRDDLGEGTGSGVLLDRLNALKVRGSSAQGENAAFQTISTTKAASRAYPKRQKLEEPEPEPPAPDTEPIAAEPEEPQGPTAEEMTAPPSIFATTMLGHATRPPRQQPTATMTDSTTFSLPYPNDPKQTNDAFAGPSPDDVVITAQSKGSQR
jgi:elongation factor 1 alpha-like protein